MIFLRVEIKVRREWWYYVEGDVGCVWNEMVVYIFNFIGRY